MALSRLGYGSDLMSTLSRILQSANTSLGDMQCTRYAVVHRNRAKALHLTSVRRYPDPPPLPLPTNVSEIFANETGRFTPERTRDITTPVLLYGNSTAAALFSKQTTQSAERSNFPPIHEDTHVDSYDCFGAVSLNGTMQSNVPKPFSSRGKSTHLNMPGGQWARDGKYIAEDMQKSHYRAVCLPPLQLNKNGSVCNTVTPSSLLRIPYRASYVFSQRYSTSTPEQTKTNESIDAQKKTGQNLSMKEKLKKAVQDYGKTVIVFHIGISLISLGAFYMAVVSGINLTPIVEYVAGGNEQVEKILGTSSNFVVAYTIHKLFAPVRLYTTLAVSPFLVRYLRRVGFLKPPKAKATPRN